MRLTCKSIVAAVAATALVALQNPSAARADEIRDRQWHLKYLNVAAAHAITKGKGVTVAVVDTGVAPHPDLKANLLPGVNVTPGGSGNGQSDSVGHGTAMAGLIAGTGRGRTRGVLGIAPESKILPVKDQEKDFRKGALLSTGIKWAVENGAKVINVSAATAPTSGLEEAISSAAALDAVVVASAGNKPQDLSIGYPAAMSGVLAVGAIDRSGKHASFSVTGDEVQICAPGAEMQSTGLKSGYRRSRGTSDSAALVSGAAALVRAEFPDLTAPQVIERLTSTATDVGPPGRDDECGFGVLNIVKALTADLPDSSGDTAEPSASAEGSAAGEVAQPSAPEDDSNGLVLVASVGGGVFVLGGLAALLLLRRRGKT